MLRILVLALALPAAAAAQCSMCRENAKALDARAMRSINAGIYILMVPPLFVVGGIFFAAWRRRD